MFIILYSEDVIKYIWKWVAPMGAIFYVIPTLKNARYLNYEPYQLRIPYQTLIKNFTFSPKNIDQGRIWTALTCLFCHADENHMTNNLRFVSSQGFNVFREFGFLGTFATFTLGGMFAAIDPFHNHLLQTKNSLGEKFSSVATFVEMQKRYVGASGGGFALFGMSAMTTIENLRNLIKILQRSSSTRSSSSSIMSIESSSFSFEITQRLSSICLSLFFDLLIILQEWEKVRNGNRSKVDNAGHINGFIFGVVFYFVLKKVSSFYQESMMRSAANRYGHRLGSTTWYNNNNNNNSNNNRQNNSSFFRQFFSRLSSFSFTFW